jgi:hypothetical protein
MQFYLNSLERFRARLHSDSGLQRQYKHLDWRLEVEVAGRRAHDVMAPSYTLRLDTVGGAGAGGPRSVHFSSDHAALVQALAALDEASEEIKTAHSKRVMRYIH